MKFLDDIYYKNVYASKPPHFDASFFLAEKCIEAFYAAVCGLSLKELNKLEVSASEERRRDSDWRLSSTRDMGLPSRSKPFGAL